MICWNSYNSKKLPNFGQLRKFNKNLVILPQTIKISDFNRIFKIFKILVYEPRPP